VGGKSRGTAPAFLQIDERRQEGAGGAAWHLGVIRGRHQSRNETRKCLTRKQKSDGGWRTYSLSQRAKPQLSKNSRCTWMTATRSYSQAARRKRKLINEHSPN